MVLKSLTKMLSFLMKVSVHLPIACHRKTLSKYVLLLFFFILIINAVFLNFTSVVGGMVPQIFSHTDVCNQGRRYLNWHMVFLPSERETVTLFCGFLKSTLLCVNISFCFQRLEWLQNERGSVVVKTDAGLTVRINRILWLAPNFWWRSKGWKENLFTAEKKNLGPFES